MWMIVLRSFPLQQRWIAFDFTQRSLIFPALIGIGVLYNLGIWIDKFMFWYYPPTSQQIIGGLRASPIFDLPGFLSYLSIIPGMAGFPGGPGTHFVEEYDKVDRKRGGVGKRGELWGGPILLKK